MSSGSGKPVCVAVLLVWFSDDGTEKKLTDKGNEQCRRKGCVRYWCFWLHTFMGGEAFSWSRLHCQAYVVVCLGLGLAKCFIRILVFPLEQKLYSESSDAQCRDSYLFVTGSRRHILVERAAQYSKLRGFCIAISNIATPR
ncbi:hypothetical protein L6164_029980 [Bauhinia variegata]|uniref:Uncharacterized protein n=1 Tax=Bauhinia variegata TaxID=167791 RepID=A0ACB9LB81_BAUVA|nr:hypothetical protein L6164_029980 [Bauhinia variegata]